MKRHGQDITSYERKYLIEHQKPLDYFKQTFYIEKSKNNYELYYETSQESMQDKLLLMDKICISTRNITIHNFQLRQSSYIPINNKDSIKFPK